MVFLFLQEVSTPLNSPSKLIYFLLELHFQIIMLGAAIEHTDMQVIFLVCISAVTRYLVHNIYKGFPESAPEFQFEMQMVDNN